MCHSSKAALSQSRQFALFVNLVARSSTDEFFTLWDVHSSTNHRRRLHACSAGMSSCPCRRSMGGALRQELSLFRPHTRLTLQEAPVVARSSLVYARAPHFQ